jgi:hypothetical protein
MCFSPNVSYRAIDILGAETLSLKHIAAYLPKEKIVEPD